MDNDTEAVTAVHPYFEAKARKVIQDAGGDPAVAGALAVWADRVRASGDDRRGVIVAEDGEIIAETERRENATYVTEADRQRLALINGNELGLARAELRRRLGKNLIHVRAWEVCTGQSVSSETAAPIR